MENTNTDWTKEEFRAYTLLYAATADFNICDKEKTLILNIVNKETYTRIYEELEADNDFQRVEKIHRYIERQNYKEEDLKGLVEDMKALFLVDGNFDVLEKQLLMGLKRILNKRLET